MRILERTEGTTTVVSLQGSLDRASAPEVEGRLLQLFQEGMKSLVLDFGQTDFLASGGIKALLKIDKRAKELGGQIVLVALSEPLKGVLSMIRLLPYFRVYPTVTEGLAALAPPKATDGAR